MALGLWFRRFRDPVFHKNRAPSWGPEGHPEAYKREPPIPENDTFPK